MVSGARWAGLVRIATGLLFFAEGYGKVTGPFVRGGFAKNAESMLKQSWPFWRSFLESVVLPRPQVFAWAVALGELLCGIALLLGFFTRIAAAAGVALLLTILLGQTYVAGSGWVDWVTAGLTTKFAILLLLSIAAAGYGAWGLDGRRRRVRPGFR